MPDDTERVVELDWADDSAANRFGEATAKLVGLKVRTLDPYGSGGGWPILRFAGPSEAIGRLIAVYDLDAPLTRLYDVEHPFDALDQDECDAIGADGRDGRGWVTESNLTDLERQRLEVYRGLAAD